MFGGCEIAPPKLRDFSMFSKQATGSRNQATAKLQEAGLWQRSRAEKDEKKSVTFLGDCQCFLGEVKFSIQTQSSAQLPQQVPDTTSSSPGTHPTTLEDKTQTPFPNMTATKEEKIPLPPPYAEVRRLLDALQKQMPQTKPTTSHDE